MSFAKWRPDELSLSGAGSGIFLQNNIPTMIVGVPVTAVARISAIMFDKRVCVFYENEKY